MMPFLIHQKIKQQISLTFVPGLLQMSAHRDAHIPTVLRPMTGKLVEGLNLLIETINF